MLNGKPVRGEIGVEEQEPAVRPSQQHALPGEANGAGTGKTLIPSRKWEVTRKPRYIDNPNTICFPSNKQV